MLKSNRLTRSTVTRPNRPSVARKAKASGTPAKFDATPENVRRVGRTQRGSPPEIAAYATKKPMTAPPIADAALTWMLIQYALRMVGWKRSRRLASVRCPSASWNAPTIRKLVGRIRKKKANRKNGRTPRNAQENWPGRGAPAPADAASEGVTRLIRWSRGAALRQDRRLGACGGSSGGGGAPSPHQRMR